MRYFTVTVNGTAYDVAVEETSGAPTIKPVEKQVERVVENPQPMVNKGVEEEPARTEQKEQIPVHTQPLSNVPERVTITAPMPGKILDIKVNPGANVKRGEVLFILEAMKMENEIVSPEDGTIARIAVTVGNNVESGDILATLS